MIGAPHKASDAETPTHSETTPGPQSRRRWLALVAGVAIVALSTAGLLMSRSSDIPAIEDPSPERSSSGRFLQPGDPAEAGGPVRIEYQGASGSVSLPNGGVVPLSEDLQFEVSVSPYPPTSFEVEVDLYLTTVAGEPVVDANISAVWDMPFMWHGPFETEFRNAGGGHYAASFDFFMFGPWELVTHVSAPAYDPPDDLSLSIYVWPE